MKKFRMALVAFAAITGIGGAFATSHKNHLRGGTFYYSQKINATQSVWKAVQPSTPCQASSLDCTITSTSSNVTSLAPDTFPAQYSTVNNSGQSHKM